MSGLLALLLALSPLARSPSPYLREAAGAAIPWRPFGPAAFAEAQAKGLPLLVDDGAGWCHWCHVMDEGTYARPEIAALVGRLFVPVKVDRDFSPDLDERFQREAGRLTGAGGWPLTLFLDPQGHTYYAASYLPPDAMAELLQAQAGGWRAPSAAALRLRSLRAGEAEAPAAAAAGSASLAVADRVGGALLAELDAAHGGFGREGPKFPNGPAVRLALWLADRAGGPGPYLDAATATLDGMAKGGVRDHVGGGFHRYAVDPAWAVPHFEKLLYVNAALLRAYVEGWLATGNAVYREVASETVDFLLSPAGSDPVHGGCYASEDSDAAPGDDGSYYTWTLAELRTAGGEEAVRFFGARALPRDVPSEPSRNVLREAALEFHPAALLARLRAARAGRRAPRVDPTLYAGWNGLAATALLEAGAALGRPEATRAALAALDLFLRHSPGVHALSGGRVVSDPAERRLDDLAGLGLAALAAFEATGEPGYLRGARALREQADRRLWDGAAGWYRLTTAPDGPLPDIADAPTPAPEAAMALFLARLAKLDGDAAAGERADRLLAAFAGEAPPRGPYAATYALALLERRAPSVHVAIVERAGTAGPLRQAALAAWRPGKTVRTYRAGREQTPYPAAARGSLAYVCGRSSCAPPTADPRVLRSLVERWEP
ncbi:MAG: thioredoxin domain-containing protein [Myxococcales bacterium]